METHTRRHGPAGYSEYDGFKPWLRDEFHFRCVYCLIRETHYPDRQAAFSVEHIVPRSVDPDRERDYENLAYACRRCNSYRRDVWPLLDPCESPYGKHLRMRDNGEVEGLTPIGVEMVRVLKLNHPDQIETRQFILLLIRKFEGDTSPEAAEFLWVANGFPRDLPNLRARRPPGKNTRPEGLDHSYYARSKRGELPNSY